jgi:hypothetical protein
VNWFTKFFQSDEECSYQFGRDIAVMNSAKNEVFYKTSEDAFYNKNMLDGCENYLKSLILSFDDDESIENKNIEITRHQDSLEFTLIQGSAKVHGTLKEGVLKAYSIVASSDIHVAIKRRMLERNYQFTYARFYSENDKILLKIHLDTSKLTPTKIFYPLREIALNSDHEKEFIASEFSKELLLDIDHIQTMNDEEKKLKYRYLQKWIQETQSDIEMFPSDENSSLVAFSYLALLFKIDYLLVPREKFALDLVKNLTEYFGNEGDSIESKNSKLEKLIIEIKEYSFETFSGMLYPATYTFSVMEKGSHSDIELFIEETLKKIRWFKSNRNERIIVTLYLYMSLYLLYNFALHPSMRGLLHIMVQVHMSEFFEELGCSVLYHASDDNSSENKFSKRDIQDRIDNSIKPYDKKFPHLTSFSSELNFNSLESFSQSFFVQLKHLDYSEL